MAKPKQNPCGRIYWDDEMNSYFREIVPGKTKHEIKELFYQRFGIQLTDSSFNNKKRKLGIKQGVNQGHFAKGYVPFNKGVPASKWKNGIPKKPKEKPAPEIGQEWETEEGYINVRIAPRTIKKRGDNWKRKHVLIWETHNGPLPEGHSVVFADGNKNNFDPDNLVAVPRSCWATINYQQIPFHDRESLLVAIDIAKIKSKTYELSKRDKHGRSSN